MLPGAKQLIVLFSPINLDFFFTYVFSADFETIYSIGALEI